LKFSSGKNSNSFPSSDRRTNKTGLLVNLNVSLGSAILRLLREQPHQPGALASLLDASRLQVQDAVSRLRESGVDIPLHPLRGYLLQSLPEKLLADDLLSRPGTAWLGEIWTLESTGSTNTVALEQGQLGLPGPLAIFAEHQTAGRGRFARKWESDAGDGLSLSLLLRPTEEQRFWPRLTTLAALAVARCAATFLPEDSVQIKWPNDVVASGKKIAGILAETGSDPLRGNFVVLGIGLNVNQTDFPAPLNTTATSLRMIAGHTHEKAAVAACLLGHLGELLPLLRDDFSVPLREVQRRSSVLGRRLTLHTGTTSVEGTAEALDPEARLQLRMDDGTLQSFSAGEVSLKPI
jgi:BirA family biotin operon repressor/biotin-[acetyl-CoA-carboxylase] ligase